MSRIFLCDSCEETHHTVAFEVKQATAERDCDGDQIIQLLHFCTPKCFADFAMGLLLEFGEDLSDTEGDADG